MLVSGWYVGNEDRVLTADKSSEWPSEPSPLSISVQLSHPQSETSQFLAQSHEVPKTTDDCAREAKAHVRSSLALLLR